MTLRERRLDVLSSDGLALRERGGGEGVVREEVHLARQPAPRVVDRLERRGRGSGELVAGEAANAVTRDDALAEGLCTAMEIRRRSSAWPTSCRQSRFCESISLSVRSRRSSSTSLQRC